ncbi:N-acetyltransferase YodP [Pelotomaculum schinkii]|uniref:N-acetyltransferase YodP n=1 Tax=Pelotomaculum schinkii TaxID=78350 RepID=A0A4Y7R9L4_9FIRM|nr:MULTISPECIES: putative beta-lysine N-acetyltransferase [Pelotomaculum]TEB05472.1 N-acetyltransferase YodP [Pelotomaculum schinkii]TEB14794.1 N-acetyltransferase YodP [Pelotomaculum sp. FP]
MSIEIKKNEDIYLDRWEIIEGNAFDCRILVSPYNRRITVYEFNLTRDHAAGEMVELLAGKALENGLDKIWLKSKTGYMNAFAGAGMKLEAAIPGYYKGKETALVFALYLSNQRQTPSHARGKELVDQLVSKFKDGTVKRIIPDGITFKWGEKEHCPALARLYRKVFTTYPFPVFDPDYLKSTIAQDSTYYITAWHNRELIAASSAEINRPQQNAEMTDFATLPQWRGHGLASFLLEQMETRLKGERFRCLYTIARSSSIGMNSVFVNAGYGYYGVLIKNCNIGVGFEDMNVWAKLL